ncbi:MAG: hypothetical protein M0R80_03895 [Proteobacteria bacterium]|jgi:hypothetical protein|nr:hypothetical protein [Pseudomonadota bacterium]
MKELLVRLQKCDPATWNKINDKIGIRTICWEDVCSLEGSPQDIHMGECVLDSLQGELQRAISSQIDPNTEKTTDTWSYSVEAFRDEIRANVYRPYDMFRAHGDTPAQALLIAYINAKEAT